MRRNYVLQLFFAFAAHVWRAKKATEWEHLPEQNAVSPDVALHGVDPLEGALGRHPLHRQAHLTGGETLWVTRRRSIERATYRASCSFTHVSSHDVVGVIVDVPGQPKVADFDQPAFRHQNVSGCQVSVDTLWRINKAGMCDWLLRLTDRKRSSMYVIEGCKCFI